MQTFKCVPALIVIATGCVSEQTSEDLGEAEVEIATTTEIPVDGECTHVVAMRLAARKTGCAYSLNER